MYQESLKLLLVALTVAAAAEQTQYDLPIVYAEGPPGAFECPCLNGTHEGFAKARAKLMALGYPDGYGGRGCQAYDKNNRLQGCRVPKPPDYCNSPWCYVDMEKCPVQKTKCEAAGGLLGSTISPYCRERESTASFILHHSVDGAFSNRTSVDYPVPYFSYTTCGALDAYQLTHYGEEQIFKEIGGHNLIVSAPKEKYAPWVLREKIDPANLQWGGYTGVLPTAMKHFQAALELNITLRNYFASPESKRANPGSSFTACAYDVKVGNVDVCIGNFWVTSERLALSNFIQPFAEDKLYLVVPDEYLEESFAQHFVRPFMPFAPELWLMVGLFTIFTSIVTLLVDGRSLVVEHYDIVSRYCMSVYLTWHGLFSGGPQNSPGTFPARLSQLGFGVFIMITVATYTANLATILVSNTKENAISNIDDAMAEQMTICMLSALIKEAETKYPTAKLVGLDHANRVFRELQKGTCEAAILSADAIDEAHAGLSNKWDCDEVNAHAVTGFTGILGGAMKDPFFASAQSACRTDEDSSTRDCNFHKVGPMLLSVPLSMPSNSRYTTAISFYFRKLRDTGEFERMVQDFAYTLDSPACAPDSRRRFLRTGRRGAQAGWRSRRSDQGVHYSRRKYGGASAGGTSASTTQNPKAVVLSLPWTSMLGIVLLAVFVQVIALALWAVEKLSGRSLGELVGVTALAPRKDAPPDSRDHQPSPSLSGMGFEDNSSKPAVARCEEIVLDNMPLEAARDSFQRATVTIGDKKQSNGQILDSQSVDNRIAMSRRKQTVKNQHEYTNGSCEPVNNGLAVEDDGYDDQSPDTSNCVSDDDGAEDDKAYDSGDDIEIETGKDVINTGPRVKFNLPRHHWLGR